MVAQAAIHRQENGNRGVGRMGWNRLTVVVNTTVVVLAVVGVAVAVVATMALTLKLVADPAEQ